MLGSGRFLYKQLDSFPKVVNSIPVVRHCKAVNQSEGHAPVSSDNIVIPKRIERGPTDILKALASTVKQDFTAFEYKYPDDPFFYSYSPFYKKVLGLALESGRKSAKWIVDNNPGFFKHQLADPPIEAFLPESVISIKSEPTEKALISTIKQRNVMEAIGIFKALQTENIEISDHTKQCLLELVCFYNCEPKPKEELESKWFADSDYSPQQMNTWKNKDFAEELFDKMDSSCSLANSAIIQGMFKYNEIFKGSALFEKARVNKIKLSVGAYNAYLANSHILAGKEPLAVFIKRALQEMAQKNIKPNLGTLNAILESLEKSNSFPDKEKLALQVLGEFEYLGIEPSLGSYGLLFCILGKTKDLGKPFLLLIKDIMSVIGKQEHEILHSSDLKFFVNAMTTFSDRKTHLVTELHEMLLRNDNLKFITNNFDQNAYYQKLYHFLFQKKPLDLAMKIYRNHFNTVPPSVKTLKVILQAMRQSPSTGYFVEVWEDLKKLNCNKNRAVLRHVINYVENCEDEASLKVVHDAAICFLERCTFEDLLAEDQKSMSNLLLVFVRNDDENSLLEVFKKFQNSLEFSNLEDSALDIIFRYAISKKNHRLIRYLLAIAHEMKLPNTAKMAEEALLLLNEKDAAWARELMEEKTKD